MAKTATDYIANAQAAFEAGFASKAAQKRALDELNRAYSIIRQEITDGILKARTADNLTENSADFWAIPFDLHQVREKHLTIATRYGFEAQDIRNIADLRAAIKGAELAAIPAKPESEIKAEGIRRSIMEEMERRKAMFVNALELGRIMGEIFPDRKGAASLHVTVNAHWVHGHKGTDFIRHFFYLNGKLTPLATIIAAAEALEAEKGEAA